jgi:hypothetical protein
MLISLGVGLVIVGVLKAIFRPTDGRTSLAGVITLVTLLLAFGASQLRTIIHWQARWGKDRSIELHLRDMPPSPASTYWIDEEFPVADEVAHGEYQEYDWSCIFETAWGGESRVGLSPGMDLEEWWTGASDYREFAKIRNIADYDPGGSQARLIIRAGRRAGGADMVLMYWLYEYLGNRGAEAFTKDVTVVTVEMLPEEPSAP